MLIKIIRVNQCNREYPVVEFLTSIGSGIGFWRSGPLKRLGHYNVEFDFDDELFWGINIDEVESKESYIKIDGGYTVFQGQLESIDRDGTLAIRLGDAIILCEGRRISLLPGAFVRIKLKEVSLYDINA
jgi:hypothetical protein